MPITAIGYMYRDNSNYKSSTTARFNGAITAEQKQRIEDHCFTNSAGELCFYPDQVRLRDPREDMAGEYDDDPAYSELGSIDVRSGSGEGREHIDAFVERFCSTVWEHPLEFDAKGTCLYCQAPVMPHEGAIVDAEAEASCWARSSMRDKSRLPHVMIGPLAVVKTEEGHVFEPWTDGHAVGFRVTEADTGRVKYVYLNPSSADDMGAASVFLYEGAGDPGVDGAHCYVDLTFDPQDAAVVAAGTLSQEALVQAAREAQALNQ